MKYIILSLLAFTSAVCSQGATLQREPSVKTAICAQQANGLGGILMITSDADWQARWSIPAAQAPHFTPADRLKVGQAIFFLVFITNPQKDAASDVNVSFDLKLTDPNGKISQEKGEALKGHYTGAPKDMALAPVGGFDGEKTDPKGEYTLDVTLHDLNRKIDLPLKVKFTLSE